ncbi:DctP family TRAP transporter solute-binding subunit [Catenovulum agarivorans]|uniref:DctP family TRAP transporter solute-binding subunit n=1 Tax=Catenovulum agarivorans TaxID=1172192 RepID=UPI001ED9211D|nr:DctP family TRAP transporter solute-binding subunit [Catenovulum agarivorans]
MIIFKLRCDDSIMKKVFFVLLTVLCMQVVNASERLLWGHVYETSEPLHKWAVWAAEQIKVKSEGRIEIDIFPISILGKEAELNESLSLGVVDIIYTGTSFAAQLSPSLAIADLPYVFDGYSHWQAFNQSDLLVNLAHDYASATNGNQILGNSYYGQRHVTSNKPIVDLAGMQNLKIRVPNASIFKEFPLAVGANPTPIAFSEVYMALQQGVVDAQENPLPTIKAKKLFEVQKHINLTGHLMGSILTIVSSYRWNKLPEQDKKIVQAVLQQAAEKVSEETRNNELALINWFQQNGISVNQVDTQSLRQATLKRHAPYITKVGRENYQQLIALNSENNAGAK